MALLLFLGFLLTPLVEIGVFIQVGGWLGLWPTLALVVATAVAGTWLLRLQGLGTLARARAALARGEPPVAELFDGACLLLAGALLLTPGFVTDELRALLLVPALRRLLLARLARHFATRAEFHASGFGRAPGTGAAGGGATIEGEFHEVDPDAPQAGDADAPSRRLGRGSR